MRKDRLKTLFAVVAITAFALKGAPSFAADQNSAAVGPLRTVELIADKDNRFKFANGQSGPLELKAGETVKFRITSHFGGEKARDGAEHSFVIRKLRDKGWSVRLYEGVQEFTLVAPPPGKYLIECTVECGTGHDDMSLKMLVVK
jgi:heme/copper-type cytochrome/quinol oxidase subunit 2